MIDSTRRDLLVNGARATAAGVVGAALLAPAAALAAATSSTTSTTTTATTTAEPPESEPERLARLVRVELLLLFSYQQILASSLLNPRAERTLRLLRAQEEAHIHALGVRLAALGGVAPPPPTGVEQADRDLARRRVSGRLGQLRGARDALRLLLAVERVTVGAYFVALTKLEDPALITLAAEIMANDAQHEAMLGELLYPGNAQQAVPYGLVQGIQ